MEDLPFSPPRMEIIGGGSRIGAIVVPPGVAPIARVFNWAALIASISMFSLLEDSESPKVSAADTLGSPITPAKVADVAMSTSLLFIDVFSFLDLKECCFF